MRCFERSRFLPVLKSIFAVASILFAFHLAEAQNALLLNGVVADPITRKGISFATLHARDTLDGKLKASTFSEENGTFQLTGLPAGMYRISVTAVGYQTYTSVAFNLSVSGFRLDTLFVQQASNNLKEVTVAAIKPLLEIESDKMIFNVENDVTLQGMTALDALKKLPFVTVDADDNIQMKGSSNFKVLLNGKSTSLVARNPSEALKAFPSALIKKIEVITEPSAKYDAEGTAGIINIITRKKVIGHNGNINLQVNNRGMNNLGSSLNLKWGKLGISSYLGANTYRYLGQNTTAYTRITKTPGYQSTLKQFGESDNEGLGYWGNLELAYEFDSLHTLSVYCSPNGGENKSSSVQTTENYDSTGKLTDFFSNRVKSRSSYPSYDLGVDFVKVFRDNPEHEVNFSALRDVSTDRSNYNALQNFTLIPDQDIYNTNLSDNTEYTFKVDYSKPLKSKMKLETGAKMILRHLYSDYRMLQRTDSTENYSEVAQSTNVLSYDQNVGSLYSTFEKDYKGFKIKLGARAEQTWIEARFNKDSGILRNDYLNFIPTAGLSKKLNQNHTLRFNFSKRIQRPWMFYLNPYVNNQNPRSISYGNPNLDPEKTHSFSLSWNYYKKQNSLDVSFSQSFTNDVITSFTRLDPYGVAYTSFYNIARTSNTGINLNYWGMLFNKLQVWGSINSSYVQIKHQLDPSRNRSGFSNRGHGSVTWNFKHNFSATAGGWVWQGAPTLQSVRPLNYNYNLAVRKAFLKKKLHVGLVANNFLEKTQSLRTVSEDPDFSSVSEANNLRFRFLSLSLGYNFGKMRENVSRKKGVVNDDQKGGE